MTSSGGSKTLTILATPFHMGTLTSKLLLMPQKRAGELSWKTALPEATGRKTSLGTTHKRVGIDSRLHWPENICKKER